MILFAGNRELHRRAHVLRRWVTEEINPVQVDAVGSGVFGDHAWPPWVSGYFCPDYVVMLELGDAFHLWVFIFMTNLNKIIIFLWFEISYMGFTWSLFYLFLIDYLLLINSLDIHNSQAIQLDNLQIITISYNPTLIPNSSIAQKMDPTIKDRAQQLQQRAEQLQKQNKYKESLDAYQQLLDINKNLYGLHSEEYERISIKLCELCNLVSMILLQKEKYDVCLLFLKKAESFCLKLPRQTAVTYNNYACHYRKTGKFRTALMYLQSALELEWKQKSNNSLADTYLNLCAVLSQLGRHNEALENVLFSITLLQQQLLGNERQNVQRIPVLAIAYHNMAVQLEYLKRMQESLATYEKAAKFARTHLGEQHSLAQNLQNVLKNAQEGKFTGGEKKMADRRKFQNKEKVENMRKTYNKDQRPHTGFKSVKKI